MTHSILKWFSANCLASHVMVTVKNIVMSQKQWKDSTPSIIKMIRQHCGKNMFVLVL